MNSQLAMCQCFGVLPSIYHSLSLSLSFPFRRTMTSLVVFLWSHTFKSDLSAIPKHHQYVYLSNIMCTSRYTWFGSHLSEVTANRHSYGENSTCAFDPTQSPFIYSLAATRTTAGRTLVLCVYNESVNVCDSYQQFFRFFSRCLELFWNLLEQWSNQGLEERLRWKTSAW